MANRDRLVRFSRTVQYDGTNGTEIFGWFNSVWMAAELVSEGDGQIRINTFAPPGIVTLNEGDHLVIGSNGQMDTWLTETQLDEQFIKVPEA